MKKILVFGFKAGGMKKEGAGEVRKTKKSRAEGWKRMVVQRKAI